MSYEYRKRRRDELQDIANVLLQKFPQRRRGIAVDIEGIIEDLGITVLPRPLGTSPVSAYLAKNPRLIVVNEGVFLYLPRARFTLSHEVCHRILEYGLWQGDSLPVGAAGHELTDQQHSDIEADAKALAAEILQPEQLYRERFNSHFQPLISAGLIRDRAISKTVQLVADDFEVSRGSAFFRARKLDLIAQVELERLYLDRLTF